MTTYLSTRGQSPELDFKGVTLGGLAPDGGLYVPATWPTFAPVDIKSFKDKTYTDIALSVLQPFVGGSIPEPILRELLTRAYQNFDHPDITPLRALDERTWLLELFHGPTLAFKDLALQLLGAVFEYFLSTTGRHMTVIGATSGDTGSAAMAALANKTNIDVFILFPQKGPSDIQRKQMSCMEAANVHALAIDGTFDDCQAIVKALFNDVGLRAKYNFAAVNSINWLRILGQMVYYFKAVSGFAPKPVSFVVPTGNFGNVFSAYAAGKCGASISKLAVANNQNDILTRFFRSGEMKAEGVTSTLSPSMDIQVSSNFERLLFDLCHRDGAAVASRMQALSNSGLFHVSTMQLGAARQVFTAAHVTDEETLSTIREVFETTGIILDPHSAVGVGAARKLAKELPEPIVTLACAHPAKFPATIKRAIGIEPELPERLQKLMDKTERLTVLPADAQAVETFISKKVILS